MIDKKEVMHYLTQKFKGVSRDKEGILRRYENYVQFDFAQYLLEYTLPYLKPDDKILDIGSGFGSYVYLLKQHGFEAYGLEISDFLIEFSRERLQTDLSLTSEQTSQIYLKESALDIPFSNNSFDIVTIWNVLEHVTDYNKVLLEAMRVLKPGGKLFIMNVNYASCFIEPHYRVPWVPYIPKSIASKYLKLLGRNPEYFNTSIFYVSNFGVLNTFKNKKISIGSALLDKVSNKTEVKSSLKRKTFKLIQLFKLEKLLKISLKMLIWNPFVSYINIIATKKDDITIK